MLNADLQRSAPAKEKTFEFSYQRYQDRNYEFMNKKIGESDTESQREGNQQFYEGGQT
jgi:hypothetical protein